MNKYILLTTFFILCLCATAETIRLATYNIHVAKGIDKVYDPKRISAFLLDNDIDIAGLQEVDRLAKRTQFIDQPLIFELNKTYEFRFSSTVNFSTGGEYGILSLSRFPFQTFKELILPVKKGEEPRKCQIYQIKTEKRTLNLAHTHLTNRNDTHSRLDQVKTILNEISDQPNTIFFGDFNAEPSSKEIQFIKEKGFLSAGELLHNTVPTYPSNNPNQKLDYVWISPDLKNALNFFSIKKRPFSDHLPIIITFKFK